MQCLTLRPPQLCGEIHLVQYTLQIVSNEVYPRNLEEWWLNRVKDQAVTEAGIQQLSDLFTKQRGEMEVDYFRNPELLQAYGLFYFPQTYMRTQFVFREVLKRGWNPPDPVSILDLGAGTGAASISLTHQLRHQLNGIEVTAVDRSAQALNTLQQIYQDLAPYPTIKIHCSDFRRWLAQQDRRWDLIIASFSLNETEHFSTGFIGEIAGALSENGMALILEPALRETSENIERLRDRISIMSSLHVWAPCPHRQSCPLLAEGRFWCHEVRSWKPPDSLASINRRLYREIHILRFSFLAFGKQMPPALPDGSFRLISPVAKLKGRFVFTACTSKGEKREWEILSRSLKEEERLALRSHERGEMFCLSGIEPEKRLHPGDFHKIE